MALTIYLKLKIPYKKSGLYSAILFMIGLLFDIIFNDQRQNELFNHANKYTLFNHIDWAR